MCGRYVLKASPAELQKVFHLDELPEGLHARFNIAPLQAAPIILDASPRTLTIGRWGLLPRWAKEPKIASRMINARAETLSERRAFKDLVAHHRCLVPCDGFFEWHREGRAHQPHYIHAASGELLAMAGLWSRWRAPDGLEVVTFTVITTAASPVIAPIHDRMPVFLDEAGRRAWLTDADVSLPTLLRPWDGTPLVEHAVSTHVNTAAVDDPSCIAPASTEQLRLL
jgi:putative SOS response-associated peptidase YedK